MHTESNFKKTKRHEEIYKSSSNVNELQSFKRGEQCPGQGGAGGHGGAASDADEGVDNARARRPGGLRGGVLVRATAGGVTVSRMSRLSSNVWKGKKKQIKKFALKHLKFRVLTP